MIEEIITIDEKPIDSLQLRDPGIEAQPIPPGKDTGESNSSTFGDPNQIPNMRSAEHQIDSRVSVSVNFETIGRYETSVSGTGASASIGDGSGDGPLILESGTDATGRAGIWLNGGLGAVLPIFDQSPYFSTTIYTDDFDADNTKELYVIFGSVAPSLSSKITKHFGFIIKNNDGVGELYITMGNGAAQTTKLIQGFVIALDEPLSLHAKLVSGQYAEFYVNNILVYTETRTHLLPAGDHDDTSNRLWMANLVSTVGTDSMIVHHGPVSLGWKVGII